MLIKRETLERTSLEKMLTRNKAKRRKLEREIKKLKRVGKYLYEKLVNEHDYF